MVDSLIFPFVKILHTVNFLTCRSESFKLFQLTLLPKFLINTYCTVKLLKSTPTQGKGDSDYP